MTAPSLEASACKFANAIIGIGERAQLEAIDRLFNQLIVDNCPPWALAQFGRSLVSEYRRIRAMPRTLQ